MSIFFSPPPIYFDKNTHAKASDRKASVKTHPRAAHKLMKLLGSDAPQHYLAKLTAEAKPWYLRPNYDQSEILIDPDGGVRAGTTTALVERLTAHEHGGKLVPQFLLLSPRLSRNSSSHDLWGEFHYSPLIAVVFFSSGAKCLSFRNSDWLMLGFFNYDLSSFIFFSFFFNCPYLFYLDANIRLSLVLFFCCHT